MELLLFYQFRIKYRLGKDNNRVDTLSRRSDIIDNQEDQFYSILWQNEDNLLSPNNNIIVTIIIIKSEIKQRLKKIYQKNKIFKILLKKKSGFIILEIKGRLYISQLLQYWIIYQYHDDSAQRYLRILKMVELLS